WAGPRGWSKLAAGRWSAEFSDLRVTTHSGRLLRREQLCPKRGSERSCLQHRVSPELFQGGTTGRFRGGRDGGTGLALWRGAGGENRVRGRRTGKHRAETSASLLA